MPIRPDDIAARLLEWDGKHTDLLVKVHGEVSEEDNYPDVLATLCGSENSRLQEAASWLVLHCGKCGVAFGPALSGRIVAAMNADKSWAQALHICQAMKYLDLTEADAISHLPRFQDLASHKRPFLRAWAVDAVVVLGKRHGGEVLSAAQTLLANAAKDPAASVRARVRNIAI